jgi:nucleoside-diphosphate-sugar epimerase
MKRALVTGATGFIGARVLAPLRAQGFEVHVVGRSPSNDRQVVFHKADILETEQIRKAVQSAQATHLLHLGWYAEPGQYWRSPLNLEWVSGSLNLVRTFVETGGLRAVIAGTCAEYQWGSSRFHETQTCCAPATFYGASKDALRRVLVGYSEVAPLSLAWGRIFFLYGPGEKRGRLVSDAICALLSGAAFPTSHGLQRRDFMHVCDVASAFATLLDSDVNGPVNIGSGDAVTVRSVLELIAQETGNANCIEFGARPLSEKESSIVEADVTRLSHEVDYKPKYTLREGLAETVAWWRTEKG